MDDVAAHMARTREPQSVDDLLQSLGHRQEALAN